MSEVIVNYLSHFAVALAILTVAAWIYIAITPYREISLIRQGNTAAAVALGGTIIGMSIALYSVVAHSASLRDFALWGCIALACQLVTWGAIAFILRGVTARGGESHSMGLATGIVAGQLSHGIFVGTASIAVGVLNAGCLVP